MSRKFIWLSKTALSVSVARSLSTEYSNVSGMSPRGAQPTHNGDTDRPVRPGSSSTKDRLTPLSTIDPPVLRRRSTRPLPPAAPRPPCPPSASSTLLLPRSASLIPSHMASSTAG